MRPHPAPSLIVLACALSVAGPVTARGEGPSARAEALVRAGLDAMGGAETLEREGLVLEGEGWVDLAARYQGYSAARPDRHPATEALVLAADGRLAYETRHRVNADADEHLRYLIGDDGVALVDRLGGAAFWLSDPDPAEEAARYRRTVPQLLLAEALQRPHAIRALPRRPGTVAYTTYTGEILVLEFDPETEYLTTVRYTLDLPLSGLTEIRRSYTGYVPVDGLGMFPSTYALDLGERRYREMRYTLIRAASGHGAYLDVPDGLELPPPPQGRDPAPMLADRPLPEPRELSEGVYLVPNVRPGFHHLVVRQDDGLVVVDAPAGWYELQQVPAKNWVRGAPGSSVGERLLAALDAHLPDTPVKALVLTHHHSDHAGGTPAFLERGIPVYASSETLAVMESALGVTLTGAVAADGRTRIGEGRDRVELIPADGNPHAEGMLMVHLPGPGILYQSDLFMPSSSSSFPDPARVPVMHWFVEWLDASGLEPDRIYAVHGAGRVSEENLEAIRASEDLSAPRR